ncbi:unnamed protein product [Adineta ricciae]|uniref:ADP ribosyltransferase domain-containing protein n=1 Tax=Adineta ricciae TaxID=249248 RepID=A0A815H092_ADIRI|nr:unnamed protein product [Adineta ricciae]CAF1620504.1 unnamed protein product [Adineta ricciae]
MDNKTTTISNEPNEYKRINTEQMQDVIVVWLDTHTVIPYYQNAMTQLQHIANDIHTFTDNDQCVEFIIDSIDSKVCLIISAAVEQHVVPCIHDIANIDFIFIFSDDPDLGEHCTKKWSKVKGVFTDIEIISQQLGRIIRQYDFNAIPMSFVPSGKRLDQLDPSFMYTQIIKEVLLTIKFEDKHRKEFVNYYCDRFVDNETYRMKVKQLEDRYDKKTPIWWYTTERFVFGTLNRALRVMDGEVITLMGFFVADLHRQIDQLHKEQYRDVLSANSFTVYRGQGLTRKDFNKIVAAKGGLMSFNNFLSTSLKRDVSSMFLPTGVENHDVVSVRFVMTVDPKQSTTPFASVGRISQFPLEKEILFSMHSIFRINDVKLMEGNEQLYEVNLSLTSDTDEELSVLTKQIREESFPNIEGWFRLSLILSKMAQTDIAERICKARINESTCEDPTENIYNQLGVIKSQQGQYEEAMVLFKISLMFCLRSLPSSHPYVASSCSNIGALYLSMNDYTNALSFFEQALKIQLKSLPSNHPDVATSYNNIGAVYASMGDYSKALPFYEQALKIQRESFPANHPEMAGSYNNIGIVNLKVDNYTNALSFFKQALKIQQQSLPANHPDVASSHNNIGNAYVKAGDYEKALASFGQALNIWQQSLGSNHSDVASCHNNIGLVYSNMGNYLDALLSHQDALKIRQQLRPPNHRDVITSYSNIGGVHCDTSNYPEALSSYQQALEIQLKSLPSNHPDVATSYSNIGAVYDSMGDYPKALSLCEQALTIQQQSLPANHPDIATSYSIIGIIYFKMDQYSNAISCCKYALQVAEQALPPEHPNLQHYKKLFEDMQATTHRSIPS